MKEITLESLLKPNMAGMNAFHVASIRGEWNSIPKKFLTEKNLLTEDGHNNCYHSAALHGHLSQIPSHLLTPKNLLREKPTRVSPLELMLRHGSKEDKKNLFKHLFPQDYMGYLIQLERIQRVIRESCGKEAECVGFEKLINDIKARKKLQEIPALKL